MFILKCLLIFLRQFQLKSNDPRNIERTELLEILQYLESLITTFTCSVILTQFLETQPLEELIKFLGTSLSHSGRFNKLCFYYY